MLYGGDLGLPGAFLLLLLLGPVLALVLRRRWRLSVARREEVLRLAFLAAEEAARAEIEANLAFASDLSLAAGGGSEGAAWPQCAVCYSPTTTRCSRCKAVRYCSGKCQIIHWRQGHKENCHPLQVDNSQETISHVKGLQAERADLSDTSVEIEGYPHARPVETFSKRHASSESNCSLAVFREDDNLENSSSVDTSGTESSSDSFTVSSPSSCSTFSGPMETSDDASSSEDPHLLRNVRLGGYLSSDISPDRPRASENTGGCQDAADNTCASQNCGAGDSSDSETCQEGNYIHSDAEFPLQMSSKLSVQRIPFHTASRTENSSSEASPLEGTIQFKHKDAVALDIDQSVSVTCGSSDKSKGSRSLSSASPNGRISSRDGHFVSRCATSKVDNDSAYTTRLLDGTPLGTSDLKTSMMRVVQRINSSTLSRNHPSGLMSGKYNNKMLFPYELFVKLYNYDKVELRPCGLTNCGNSCYANVVLQCLAFTRPLTAYLLEGLHSRTCRKQDWCFTCEFENLLTKAKQGKSPLSPIGIISHIHNIGSNLGHGREEDAHEFLRYAIDAMQSMCLKEAGTNAIGPLAEETTLVQLTFGGYLRSKIKCMRCEGKSEQQDHMMDLTVEIDGDIGTLEEALARFTATEVLDGDNKYKCNRCKSYERAKKKLTVLEAPNVLTIALKRFQSGKFGKLNKSVRFPEYLNLAPYMSGTDDKSPVYRLYAVVVHLDIMNAAFSGHYVCYVKNTQGKWYKIDDSVVKPVELERVLKQGAYMLLYARCSPRAPSLLRKSMIHDHGNTKSWCRVPSGHGDEPHIQMARSNSVFSRNDSSDAHNRSRDYPHRTTDGPANSESFDFFNGRLHPYKADSSSDSSSLLSCSDEGSWSTESTRNSTSTEEYSEYIFGDSDPSRFSEDTNGFTRSPVSSRHCYTSSSSGLTLANSSSGRSDSEEVDRAGDWKSQKSRGVRFEGEGSPSFLYSDMSKQCRKLAKQCKDIQTDWVKPRESKSSVLLRRCSRERAAQTFY